jgi:hypothetical protein
MLRFEHSLGQKELYWILRGHILCYGCVRVLAGGKFPHHNGFSGYYLGGPYAIERRCDKCDEKHGNTFQRLLEEETDRNIEAEQDSDDD